jgi:hypothetical protein
MSLVKIQAHIRGFITRKGVRSIQMGVGIDMGYTHNQYGKIEVNYDRP